MRGARVLSFDSVADGTAIVDTVEIPRPLPLLRTLQILPFAERPQPSAALAPSRGAWQGLALVGEISADLRTEVVAATGVSRVAPAGELQNADATWDDGDSEP